MFDDVPTTTPSPLTAKAPSDDEADESGWRDADGSLAWVWVEGDGDEDRRLQRTTGLFLDAWCRRMSQ